MYKTNIAIAHGPKQLFRNIICSRAFGNSERYFVLLLVSKNTAKESTCVFIARFNNESDRSFHGKILARNGRRNGKIVYECGGILHCPQNCFY